MRSLARSHFERTMAAKQSKAAAATGDDAQGSTYDGMLTRLRAHKIALKGIKSRKAKIAAKRGYLPDYEAYVEGVLASDAGVQDDVLMTVMVWRLDAALYAAALDIAAYALRHGLAMPEGFSRDAATAVLEELADAALDSTDPALAEFVRQAIDLTAESDMPDEVRAKANKALGLALKNSDPAAASDYLKAALELDPKCGVKTELGRLEKAAAKADGT